ncbi:hypothetical protein N7468_001617 [Penicillium chermesinum]|uniref:Uncharacterized protein n=1 Tax=Penicillium chermesinum TaxID=63820 RepID=A0A9W9PGV8_9EURO|nr:uncharacterized protein N7468_001617 [Penicillium chermesinum]KAJ5246634.1 hypothetical protein N7468_001617 [Penicillium chermesinum]KAJ6144906.1 hypothetical protein N7470_008801 [Penicillium chermesinum]
MSTSETEVPEQLFLEFSIQDIIQRETNGLAVMEPWASAYVDAIRNRRFGDAVWARYHLAGDVDSETGIIGDTSKSVLQMIEEDAVGYRTGESGLYAEALSTVYERTSESDGHPEVIELLLRVGKQSIRELRAQFKDEFDS